MGSAAGDAILLSPTTRLPLHRAGPHALADGRERWPFLDGIPYLRIGRDALIRDALAAIDDGRPDDALALLLADQDDWWDGAPPPPADLARLVAERDRLTLRDAMGLLGFGRVGDYFAHRWTDPTFLAGLALVDAHWAGPRSAFELACGIGHYGRELERCGVAYAGGDVVFSKLWLARHWVVGPDARLLCFDARAPWPVTGPFDLVLCQDAFYFLEPKQAVRDSLQALLAPAGSLAVGHVHNREAANLSAGAGVTASEIDALFPEATVYDDDALTRAARDGAVPEPRPAEDLRHVEAFSLMIGGGAPRPAAGPLLAPRPGASPRPNPLYGEDGAIRWPSERYRSEYSGRATYPERTNLAPGRSVEATPDQLRRREVVDLPERW